MCMYIDMKIDKNILLSICVEALVETINVDSVN